MEKLNTDSLFINGGIHLWIKSEIKLGNNPRLAILDPAPTKQSANYIAGIKKDFNKFGITPPTVYTWTACNSFFYKNEEDRYDGVICVSGDTYKDAFTYKVSPEKDIEGISGRTKLVPCTAAAIFKIITSYFSFSELESKRVAIINRSKTIGIPLRDLLLGVNCTVLIMHSHTPLETKRLLCPNMDIIVTATGEPNSFDQYMVANCRDQLIIDVGMGFDMNYKIHSDMSDKCIYLNHTGKYVTYKDVSPITRLCLIENLLIAGKKKYQ